MGNRAEGAPARLHLSIADIGVELSWQGARLVKEPSQKFFRGFLSNGHHRRVDVQLQLHCGRLPDLKPDAMIFDAVNDNHWRLFSANGRYAGRYVFEFFAPKPPHRRVQLACMTPDFSAGEVYRRPDTSIPTRSWSLTQLMRPLGELLLVNLLSRGRGVLLHALGVSDQGEGLLFVGASGAGKSTLANLYKPSRYVTILGDERVVVTKKDGQFWLSGTPWPGGALTVSAETVPLRKVFFLEHGTRNALITDSFLNLYSLFFQQLFLQFWSGEALAFATQFVEELIRTVPACRLSFVNDARVIEFLRTEA
jgi:hypothetical protein